MSKTNRKQSNWTATRVRDELPRGIVKINVGGKTYPAVIGGALLPFATVRPDVPDAPSFEFAWSTVAYAINNGSVLVA